MNSLKTYQHEPVIVHTILEMLRDRNYIFPAEWHPDKLLKELVPTDFTDKEAYLNALDSYYQSLQEIPFISNKVVNTKFLPIDDRGNPVYVYIQEGDQDTNPFGDNQPERISISKQIANNLKSVYPQISSAKKFAEIHDVAGIHLLFVFNGAKREPIKLENDSYKEFKFEAWPKYRLKFNVSKHQLQGTIKKLSKEEADEYKERYQATQNTIQIYRLDDPIVRYYYGQPGDIFFIQRFKGGINYRMVSRKLIHSTEKK